MEESINANSIVNNSESNGMATAGLIVSMESIIIPAMGITGLVGIILSIVGLTKSLKMNGKGKAFSIAGIIIGVVGLIYGIYSVSITFSTLKETLRETMNETMGIGLR